MPRGSESDQPASVTVAAASAEAAVQATATVEAAVQAEAEDFPAEASSSSEFIVVPDLPDI